MFKILSKKEYHDITETILEQSNVINALAKDVTDIKKEIAEVQDELHPKYFSNGG